MSDSQSFKIFGENWYNASEYVRIWKRLRADQVFFADKKIIEKHKGHRCHMVRIEGQEDGSFYKVGKEFFASINPPKEKEKP